MARRRSAGQGIHYFRHSYTGWQAVHYVEVAMIFEAKGVTKHAEDVRSDEVLDSLTPEQVEAFKYELWTNERVVAFESRITRRGIVAEGDSWFDYMPGIDILDHLIDFGHAIAKVADAGDTLENMIYGAKFKRNFSRRPNPLEQTIRVMREEQAMILLFSGGGNDIAGDELRALLNHKDMNMGALRSEYVEFVFGTVTRAAYAHMINRVRTEVAPDVQIIAHGYGHAIPDGTAVVNLPLGFRFGGPWLRPALTAKNYTVADERRSIIRQLVDRFNRTLRELADAPETRDNFHYIDLRAVISDNAWTNELHLKNSAYRQVAREFDAVVRDIANARGL